MDYYMIGQKSENLEKAVDYHRTTGEKVGISTTHLSHIETGNTKLSLPVFVDIAEALSVQTDELLYDTPSINLSTKLKFSTSLILVLLRILYSERYYQRLQMRS
ncbi:MAG: helix-turn-helix domain-containing protein [Lachnospira eligens]